MERADAAQLSSVSAEQCARFRRVLEAAGYIPTSKLDWPPVLEMRARGGANLPRLLHISSNRTPLDTLARLFLYGTKVSLEQARAAMAPVPPEEWEDAGLVRIDGDSVQARVVLYPNQGLALAVDSPELLDRGAPPDFVSGVTNSTAALASFMVNGPFRNVFDLGTGCGVLALLAARSSREAFGADINPRAVAFARFNARLNGITNVHFEQGNAFAPAAGRKFDLILANPPCVIGPDARYTFRDSGMELDSLCRRIIHEAPGFLEEGGVFQCTAEWPNFEGLDWKDRMSPWVADCGCDVLVLRTATKDAVEHAEDTVLHTEATDAESQARQFEAFAQYFRRLGVNSISDGLIAMRRRTGGAARVLEFEDLPTRDLEPFGDAVLLFFKAQEALARLSDETLLEQRVRMAPGLRLESSREWNGEGWGATSFTLRQGLGFRLFATVDMNVANLARQCDGSRTVGELLAGMAAELELDLDSVAPGCLSIIRQMISRGFLLPEPRG